MVSLMFYVIYHTKSDIKGFVCTFGIVNRITKLLSGLFMIVLLSYYELFYSFNCHMHESFWLIGFLVTFFHINNPALCKTNSLRKTLDTRQKIFYAALIDKVWKSWMSNSIFLKFSFFLSIILLFRGFKD